jgi:hypothetical protein
MYFGASPQGEKPGRKMIGRLRREKGKKTEEECSPLLSCLPHIPCLLSALRASTALDHEDQEYREYRDRE